ncbi:MAG: hypothetical protein VKL59_13845 [Nostocaceae cyanobacterium]|nr:hypothetical protein [Nostocaceae cyanobacterium]
MEHRRYFSGQNIADGIAAITTIYRLLLNIKFMTAKLYVHPGKYIVLKFW